MYDIIHFLLQKYIKLYILSSLDEQNNPWLRFPSQLYIHTRNPNYFRAHTFVLRNSHSFVFYFLITPTCITSRLSILLFLHKFRQNVFSWHWYFWRALVNVYRCTFVDSILGSHVIYGNRGFFVSPLPTSISSGRWFGFSNPLLQDVDVESLLRNSLVDVGTRW